MGAEEVSVLEVATEDKALVVPLETGDGMLLIKGVRVNGEEPGLFLLDTGSNVSVLDNAVVARLRLKSTGKATIDEEQKMAAAMFAVDSLRVGPVTLRRHFLLATDLRGLSEKFNHRLAGIIGADVWSRLPFTVDYAKQRLTFHRPGTFQPTAGVPAVPLQLVGISKSFGPFSLANPLAGHPLVAGRINGELPCRLLVDLGNNSGLWLHPQFTARHPALVLATPPRQRITRIAGRGHPREAAIQQLEVFGHNVGQPASAAAFVAAGALANDDTEDATVGSLVLRDFRLTFDYANRQLWAEPQKLPTWSARLAGGLDPNQRDAADKTPLMIAADDGDVAGFAAIFKAGGNMADIDFHDQNLLHFAASGGQVAILQSLLTQKTKLNVNARTRWGVTPLMQAVAAPGNVTLLLEAGAEVNLTDRTGLTALHYAAQADNAPSVALLAKAGAKVDAASENGLTPVHAAAIVNAPAALRALHAAGADLQRDTPAGTALHAAASQGHAEIIRVLLELAPRWTKALTNATPPSTMPRARVPSMQCGCCSRRERTRPAKMQPGRRPCHWRNGPVTSVSWRCCGTRRRRPSEARIEL